MTVVTYIAAVLLIVGWVILIILSLSGKSDYDKLEKLFTSHSSKDQNHYPSETELPE